MNENLIIHRLESLNRYDIDCSCGEYSFKSFELSSDGDVVKWEDVETLLNELKSNVTNG